VLAATDVVQLWSDLGARDTEMGAEAIAKLVVIDRATLRELQYRLCGDAAQVSLGDAVVLGRDLAAEMESIMAAIDHYVVTSPAPLRFAGLMAVDDLGAGLTNSGRQTAANPLSWPSDLLYGLLLRREAQSRAAALELDEQQAAVLGARRRELEVDRSHLEARRPH